MLTLTSALQNTIRLHGGKRAIVDAETELTWRQYGDGIARAAGLLRQLGVSPGRRFAILGRNSWRQAELIYAGYWCAAVPVPINYRLAPREIAGILEDADCALLALDPAFAGLLQSSEFAGWGERVLSLQAELYDQRKSLALPLAMVEAEEDQDALMLYTGGTTGGGKGVRLSHRNIVANALQIMHVMSPHQSDVYLHATPMFHAAEVKSTIFTMFGAAHAYLPEFTPRKFLAAIEDYRVTVAGLVPTTILRLLDEPEREGFDSSSLRLISYGTSPIQPPLIRRTMAAFPGVGLQQCYGLTECSPYVAMLDEEAHRRGLAGHEQLLSSAGRPLPGTDLRIQDDDGNEVASGQVGEVVVRGRRSPGAITSARRSKFDLFATTVSIPATSAGSTRTGSSTSSIAGTTSSSRAARTSTPAKSKKSLAGIPGSTRSRLSACRTPSTAKRSWPWSCRCPAGRPPRTN